MMEVIMFAMPLIAINPYTAFFSRLAFMRLKTVFPMSVPTAIPTIPVTRPMSTLLVTKPEQAFTAIPYTLDMTKYAERVAI